MMHNSLKHVKFLIDYGGIGKLAEHARENVLFDLRHGISTSGWLEKKDFESRPEHFEHGVRYRASLTSEILEALAKIPEEMRQAAFYDLGCGKGKVLCLAARLGEFSRVLGLDYYQPFLDIAANNLKNLGMTKVELLCADMTKYRDYERESVMYMYNPAEYPVVAAVRENIEKVCDRAVLIYNKPLHAEVFAGWKLLDQKTSTDPDRCTSIFAWAR